MKEKHIFTKNIKNIAASCMLCIPFLLVMFISYNEISSSPNNATQTSKEPNFTSKIEEHIPKSPIPPKNDPITEEHVTKTPISQKTNSPKKEPIREQHITEPSYYTKKEPIREQRRTTKDRDWRLNNLLSSSYTKSQCASRFESVLFHKKPPFRPSSSLITKLRNYESLHQRCGPGSFAFNKSIEQLKSKTHIENDEEQCKYIIWVPTNGLGNRIMSLISTFLYGLLTDRVLLIDALGREFADIVCNPFPHSSWILPPNFPINDHIAKEIEVDLTAPIPENNTTPLYIYINPDRSDYFLDQTPFYCDQVSKMKIEKIPWLVHMSDQYFVPHFFLNEPYKNDADALFPEKGSVFYLLSRYLLHPSNIAWGRIMRFYDAYLAKADKKIGLQVRVFYPDQTPIPTVIDQIHACNQKEKIFPELVNHESNRVYESIEGRNLTSILVASLHSGIYQNMSAMYLREATKKGEIVAVYQPSQEGHQKLQDRNHDLQAWTEIYLLSMSDVLVTSSWSTFGYAAQGLGGHRSWFLTETKGREVPEPACLRHISMEPCYHYPPVYNCKLRRRFDAGKVLPFLKHCLDANQGVQLFNGS